jgi:hypothetical protein
MGKGTTIPLYTQNFFKTTLTVSLAKMTLKNLIFEDLKGYY